MGSTNSRPTQTQGSDREEESSVCNTPCFFFGNVPNGLRKVVGRHDPIGTPLPETPIYQRKRRQQVHQALQEDRGKEIFSSNYAGLEKELSGLQSSCGSSLLPEEPSAGLYEGPDAEQKMQQKYALLEGLGVGSTSTVHRCVSKQNGQEYACKIIDCQLMEERFQGMMEQFQTEIDALRRLQHPSIIRLYDVFLAPEKIYIVMELMEGGELFDYVVQKGTLTEEEAAGIVRKVTSALVYIHEKNICHRDLKPENLLLKEKPCSGPQLGDIDVKIIDFGLSKAMEEPVARTFLGTRGYLAPEMLQRRDYTRAVDTWALGVIVFVLVCGCLPFDDDSSTVPSDDLVRAKFVLRFPRWARELSPSAKDLLNHLLDVNPRTRYSAEQALWHPWVQGKTAPKENLLASPGRIRASPALAGGRARRKGVNGAYHPPARKYAAAPDRTPPTPLGPSIRKTSI